MKQILKTYAPVPFYFVNDEIDEREILRQLDCMKENGIKAFYLHVRDGIRKSAYGTDEFFGKAEFIVREAAKKGLFVWLYDEDSYPSGNAGGNLVFDRPELQARGINAEKISVGKDGFARKVLGKASGISGYIITKKDGKEHCVRADNCFGAVRRHWYKRELDKAYYVDMSDLKYKHVRASTCYTETMFEIKAPEDAEVYAVYRLPAVTDNRYGTQTDCLNPETAKEFISRIHDNYKKYVGDYFGNVIPGIFLDEPSVGGGGLPFTDSFEKKFEKLFGYSPKDHYYKLSADYKGDSASFRRDYVYAVNRMFEENFLLPIKRWCKKNRLLFTGHFIGEEDLLFQALTGCNVYRSVKYLDISSFWIHILNKLILPKMKRLS